MGKPIMEFEVSSVRTALIIDDDTLLRETLKDQLQAVGDFATIDEAVDGADGLAKTKETVFDIILLDVGLPDIDGRKVCREMRERGVRSPIIILTAADSDDDTITGLDAGANDYITKPFRMAVLLARVRAHLRQHDKSDDAIFVIGPYKFHPSAKMLVHQSGQKTRLAKRPSRARPYWARSGDTTQASPLTHWKRTSTVFAKRSRQIQLTCVSSSRSLAGIGSIRNDPTSPRKRCRQPIRRYSRFEMLVSNSSTFWRKSALLKRQ